MSKEKKAPRTNTHETLAFTLELLKRIPRRRKISAKELHDQLSQADFKRTIRTVERQLKTLCDHFPIECDDREKPYGYRWFDDAEGFSLPALNEQESMILMLAEEHLKSLLPNSVLKSMEGFFTQAKTNLLQQSDKKLEKQWLNKVRVISQTQPLLPAAINPQVLEEVSNALYRNLWLNIEYENASGKVSKSRVMPLGLAQQGPRLYLVCRYEDFDNERSLALHRFISAKASTMTFTRPKNFDLKTYDDDGRFGFGEGKRIQLSFKITKAAGAHLLETPLSEDQTVKEINDQYEIKATVVDTQQLEWWLRTFGNDVSSIKKKTVKNDLP